MTANDNEQDLIKEAQALIDQVQAQLAESDAALRSQGIDLEELKTLAETHLTPVQREASLAAFKANMDAVEQEVQQEMSRRSFNQPPNSGTTSKNKARRNMV